jgi:hypothetical protein
MRNEPETFRGMLAEAYRAIAADAVTERESQEWIEGLIGEALPDEDFTDWPGYPLR